MFLRGRTGFPIVLYLVFLGLNFRHAAKALRPFVYRSYVSVWKWVQMPPVFRKIK